MRNTEFEGGDVERSVSVCAAAGEVVLPSARYLSPQAMRLALPQRDELVVSASSDASSGAESSSLSGAEKSTLVEMNRQC